jgi:AAA15 family ATPase/GTPase
MISKLEITNFRCFRQIVITDLRRFNILVGDSASGKTALLEACFLLGSASPEAWMRIRQWRGASAIIRLSGTRLSYESLFRDIFYNFDKKKTASFRFEQQDGSARSLEVQYPHDQTYSKRTKKEDEESDGNAFLIEPIQFRWRAKGKEFRSRVNFKEGAIQYGAFSNVYPAWYNSPAINDAALLSTLFSELSLKNQSGAIVQAVTSAFPSVRDVTLETIAGEATLCVSFESLTEKIPVGSISSGISKYLAIMTAAAANPGGLLLIDEFEVGFYYKNLGSILKSIFDFCSRFEVQIIATTHSYEFLQTVLPMMKVSESEEQQFALLRSERKPEGSSIRVLKDPAAAIESGFEVR